MKELQLDMTRNYLQLCYDCTDAHRCDTEARCMACWVERQTAGRDLDEMDEMDEMDETGTERETVMEMETDWERARETGTERETEQLLALYAE